MPSRNLNDNSLRKDLNRAIALNRRGETAESIKLLQQLCRRFPRSAAARGYLASVYYELEKMDEAEKNFRVATILNPRSETASLGLFHSLFERSPSKALDEMKRFLAAYESLEYLRMLRDLTLEGRLVPQLEYAKVS